MRGPVLLLAVLLPGGCLGGESADAIELPEIGSLAQPSGEGGFRLGAASAATQIEDANENTDWYVFTLPEAEGGLGQGAAFVGEASRGFSKALEDVALIEAMNLDSYRFSVSWARIEPERDVIDEDALAHYSDFIDALLAAGVRPMITLHHFSNPVWVADPRARPCEDGPSDENLCGLGHPEGGPLVVEEMAEHAALLAERFGDRVDEWVTVNEPINYLLAAYGIGMFPPGKSGLFDLEERLIPVFRDYLAAHAAMYRAIHESDTVDADGDGAPAAVGMTLAVADWVPSRDNAVSEDPNDIGARERLVYVFHHLFGDSIVNGTFDTDLDGDPDEDRPEWRGTLDWLGLQYYFRAGVTGTDPLIPVVELTPCFGGFDFGACVPAVDPTYCVPEMHYEFYAPGLYDQLLDFSGRYPGLPLIVSEAGIATETGARRAENVVRVLEQVQRARDAGVDLRGYYHWSIYDNFEWAEGYGPRFGLYRVNYTTFDRTPTLGAEVLGEIAGARVLTTEQRRAYGGDGPMTREAGAPEATAGFCP